jgi:hypothetical protein
MPTEISNIPDDLKKPLLNRAADLSTEQKEILQYIREVVYQAAADNCLAPKARYNAPISHRIRGRYHGVAPVFLPARTAHTRVAVLPASLCLAE